MDLIYWSEEDRFSDYSFHVTKWPVRHLMFRRKLKLIYTGEIMKYVRIMVLIQLVLLLLSAFSVLYGEDTLRIGWNNKMVGTLNFTQTSFDNWTAGGENSWAWIFNITGNSTRRMHQSTWKNIYKLEFGQAQIGDEDSKNTADEIFAESEYAYDFSKHWGGYTAVNGRSQLMPGYDYSLQPKVQISSFLNPAYFRESAGLKFVPLATFNSRLGASLKQTLVTDDQYAPIYTDKSDTDELEKLRNEIGLELVSNFKYQLNKIVVYATLLDIFSNIKGYEEIDVRWDNLFTAEVLKYISVNFNFQLFYDRDLSTKRQLKQYLAVGITYKFL